MIELVLVGAGGIAGTIARYKTGQVIQTRSRSILPWGTFAVNIAGSTLLGMLVALNPDNNAFALLGDGFLGAYTTFSTYMYENCILIQKKQYKHAMIYLIGSLLTGLIGFIFGALIVT